MYRLKKYHEYPYTTVFRDVISRRHILQKSNRANHLQCSHPFFFAKYVRPLSCTAACFLAGGDQIRLAC